MLGVWWECSASVNKKRRNRNFLLVCVLHWLHCDYRWIKLYSMHTFPYIQGVGCVSMLPRFLDGQIRVPLELTLEQKLALSVLREKHSIHHERMMSLKTPETPLHSLRNTFLKRWSYWGWIYEWHTGYTSAIVCAWSFLWSDYLDLTIITT